VDRHLHGLAEAALLRVRLASGGDAEAVAQRLRARPEVRDAYPDRIVSVDLEVDDPLLGNE